VEVLLAAAPPWRGIAVETNSKGAVGLFHHFPALQELKISVCPYLMSLPLSMQNLTSLQSLEIYVCNNIAALPDWLGDLSSLKFLIINQCNSIKFLPPCIEQLTKLQKLQIVGNLELKQWCESEENKKKLAHIIQIVSLIINCILTEFSFQVLCYPTIYVVLVCFQYIDSCLLLYSINLTITLFYLLEKYENRVKKI
jgi:hypothetical protein